MLFFQKGFKIVSKCSFEVEMINIESVELFQFYKLRANLLKLINYSFDILLYYFRWINTIFQM